MNSITESLGSKMVAGAVGLALAISLFAFAPSANAQTIEELNAQIQNLLSTITSLQAQLATLQGGTPAPTTGGSGFTFTRNLSEGDTGEDVRQLQVRFNAEPGIQVAVSGAGSPGLESTFFGSLTKAAATAYQNKFAASILTPVGLAAGTGFVGPSTRAQLNASAGAPGVPGTPGVVAPGGGSEGSLTVTLESFPSNGTDVDKGETKNVAAIEIEADDSDITVNRLDVNFNVRPWLYLSSIAILDGSTVVRELTNLSSSSFTELTEGSDYRSRLTGLNVLVPQGTKKVFTLRVTALANVDKPNTTITVTFQSNSVRGTDTAGITHEEPNAALSGRTFDFMDNTTGNVKATLDANSPEERNVITTNTGTTENVELMRFELEAEHSMVDINSLRFTVGTNNPSIAAFDIFDEIWLGDDSGNRIASAGTIATTTIFAVSDLDGLTQLEIPSGTMRPYRLMATIKDSDDFASSTAASTTLAANTTNIVGEDSDFDTVTVTSSTVTGSDVHFYDQAAEFSAYSASSSSVENTPYLASVSFGFTATAKGGDIFIAKAPGASLATSTTASSSSLTTVTAGGSTSGDTATSYKVGSGASRTFTFSGEINNLNGASAGSKQFKITGINWGDTDGTNAANQTDFNLEPLEVNRTLTTS